MSREDITESPEVIHEMRCGDEVSCVALRGGRLAAGAGGAVSLWRWEGGGWVQAAREGGAHRYGVTCVRWAGGGRVLASGGGDGVLRLWGTGLGGRGVLTAPGAAAVRALCWAGDARLISGHDDGAARVWAGGRGALLATLWTGEGALHAVCAPGPLLLTACSLAVVRLWPLQRTVAALAAGRPPPPPLLWADGAHDLGVLCAVASPDGSLAATGGHDDAIRLWGSGDTVGPAGTLSGHSAAVTALSWAAALLASCSLDGSARLWTVGPDGAEGRCLASLPSPGSYPTALALHDTAPLLVAAADHTVRTWALAPLDPSDPLEHPCTLLQHYAVGDLQGIEPMGDELEQRETKGVEVTSAGASGADRGARLTASAAHGGAVNVIASDGNTIVTASSDGCVRQFQWKEHTLELERTVQGDGYPLLALAMGGGVIAAGGMGGGCMLLGAEGNKGIVGGATGVRGVALSPHRPPLLLLATDDGAVTLYRTEGSTQPEHEYADHCGAALCVSWHSNSLAASGGEAGALMLHSPPPNAHTLLVKPDAHELGVLSMEFASSAAVSAVGCADGVALLATAGCDGLVKLWMVDQEKDESSVSLRLVREVCAAGGGMSVVRWGGACGTGGALLAGGGAERWARVWRVREGGEAHLQVHHVAAAPVRHAGGAVSMLLMDGGFLALGTMGGDLTVWELPALNEAQENGEHEDDQLLEPGSSEQWCIEEAWDGDPRWWGVGGVKQWLAEHLGEDVMEVGDIQRNVLRNSVTGGRLLDEPFDDIVELLLEGVTEHNPAENVVSSGLTDGTTSDSTPNIRSRLVEELRWLRAPPPPVELASLAPHALLCPISHALIRWPVRAADGITYDRSSLREWFIAAGGAVSFLPGRAPCPPISPNHGALLSLRSFLTQHGAAPPPAPP